MNLVMIVFMVAGLIVGWKCGFVKCVSWVVKLICGLFAGAFAASIPAPGLLRFLLFAAGFAAASAIVGALLKALDKVFKLPVIGLPNRFAGAIVGVIGGIAALSLVMWMAAAFVPHITEAGALLSPETLSSSGAAGKLFGITDRVLPM